MKNIKLTAAALAACLAMIGISSCTNDDSGANNGNARVQQRIDEYNTELRGAPNGWIAEINTVLGGIHTLWMRFEENGRVSMYFDYVEYYRELETTAYESSYRIKPLQLPTLSFDTYSFLSIFADPNQLNNGAGQAGTGLGSDYEYEILEYKNDEFKLLGLKNSQSATLRKATAGEHAAILAGNLMSNVDNAASYQPCFHVFTYKGVRYDFISNGRSTAFLNVSGLDPVLQSKGSKVDFDGNIVMMEPLVLGDTEISYFTKTENGYTANLGTEILHITKAIAPAVSLAGPSVSDHHNFFFVSNAMQNRWSSEFFFAYRQALQNLFYWSFEKFGVAYYTQYILLTFYMDKALGLEVGFSYYSVSEGLDSKIYGLRYYFDSIDKNPDGSWTVSEGYQPLRPGPDDAEQMEQLAPIFNYFKGNRFFIKPWPVQMGSYPMAAFIPVDNRELGVLVGAPMTP